MQRVNPKDFLKIPVGEWFHGKIIRHDHVNDITDIHNALESVPELLRMEDRRRFTESCFGHLLDMHKEMNFSAGIVHRMLLRELHHNGPEDEMRFLLGKHTVRFSKVEFCVITGLRFGIIPDPANYEMVQNGIHDRYFQGRVVENEDLKAVLRSGPFEQQYDAVKLSLLFLLNWILMGVDERYKIPFWQFQLVEDLDAFDAFPWGAYVYRRTISGLKHALDGPRQRSEQRQQQQASFNTTETYNIYGLAHALLIFAFEVIPELSSNKHKCGERRVIELPPPRILKWELTARPQGKKLDKIFTERMFARAELVPTEVERRQQYYEGIDLGGSLYDDDAADLPRDHPDPDRHRTAGPSDTEESYYGPSDMDPQYSTPSDLEGSEPEADIGIEIPTGSRRVRFSQARQPRPRPSDSDLEGRSPTPVRHRRVRFTLPRRPAPEGQQPEGVQEHPQGWEQKLTEVMDAVRTLRTDVMEAIRQNEEKRNTQHLELVAMIRTLQGATSTSQGPTSQGPPSQGPPSHGPPSQGPMEEDPPFDDLRFHDYDGAFSTGRTGTDHGETGSGSRHGEAHTTDTVPEQQALDALGQPAVPGDTETAFLERIPSQAVTAEESSQMMHDPVDIQEMSTDRTLQRTHPVNPSKHRPPVDPSTTDPSTRSSRRDLVLRIPRSQVDHRGRSSSSDRTDPRGPELTPPPLRRGERIRRRGWMERSPYTDPCLPKRARVMPPPAHEWNPHGLVDPEQLEAYEDYKRSMSGELRDVDLTDPVGVPVTWFHRLQTNRMELEDTHIDAYLKIVRRRQRLHPTVYGSRINILDSQFYTLLNHQWDRIGTGEGRKPPSGWTVYKHQWSRDELMVVRGELPLGNRPWHDVDIVLIPCNVGGMHWVMASIDLQYGHILVFDSFRRDVPFRHRNAQFACLRYLLPSQLYTVHFHRNRQRGDKTYTKKDGPFRMLYVSADRVPQQELGGNCGAHTLRMIEYLTANRDTFDWTEADMPIIRQKMAVEVYCNSRTL